MPELKLKRNFPAVYPFNTNFSEERVQVLVELTKLLDKSPNIFKKSNIYRYVERPNSAFCNEKCSALDYFCFAEFLAYYTIENRSNKTSEYQLDELDNLIENNHEEYSFPKKIKFMISGETMQCRKVRRIRRYHVPNKLLSSGKFAHVLLLLYSFRGEKDLLSGFPPLH